MTTPAWADAVVCQGLLFLQAQLIKVSFGSVGLCTLMKMPHGKLLCVLKHFLFVLVRSKSRFSQVSRLALGHDGPSRPKRRQFELPAHADRNRWCKSL